MLAERCPRWERAWGALRSSQSRDRGCHQRLRPASLKPRGDQRRTTDSRSGFAPMAGLGTGRRFASEPPKKEPTMSKIIVGIDDPERSKDAVALAAQLARASGAGLDALCAYPYDDRALRGANSGYRTYLREDAEERIAKACQDIADLPPVTPHTVADPSPARGIEHTVVH